MNTPNLYSAASATPLHARACVACNKDTPALSAARAQELLVEIPHWTLHADPVVIERTFVFPDYPSTMAFANAVAQLAQREDHHPDLLIRYKTCTVCFSTHAIGGLSENDFICAAKVDQLAHG